MQSIEVWRPIPDYEGYYEVSSIGNVRRVGVSRPNLRLRIQGGYHALSLSVRGVQKMERVHRLVARAFIGPGGPGLEVCHYNAVKTDNRVENLRWDTHRSNMRDMMRTGAPHLAPKQFCRKAGHAMTPDNTVRNGGGRRLCRTCRNASQAVWQRARRAKEEGA